MFIQVTGLDGSGTSSIAERLKNKSDNAVVLKTPSNEYEGRKIIDTVVRQDSDYYKNMRCKYGSKFSGKTD